MSAHAQDLALLLLDDTSGRSTVDLGRRHRAVGSALLLDLVRAGRVRVDLPGGAPKDARPVVLDAAPTGDAALDRALSLLTAKDRKLAWAAENIGHACWEPLMERLAERGLVRRQEGRFLGLIKTSSWPAEDTSYEATVVARVRAAVTGDEPANGIGNGNGNESGSGGGDGSGGAGPDESTVLLVMILDGIGALSAVLPDEDPRAVAERAGRLVAAHRDRGPWSEAFKGLDTALFTVLFAS
ncbi:GOLPH3/VPS74 family protein [Streptomyces roseicoloratus]|uniref:GOLPH3/VPS74 family protein n=1 Tax=Streptomyces roseicoloratus TaxID=2508722 RepID=UPI001009C0F6|nr:GPP34 family phosphoprotein [Streptomyces roseicoloratus]